MEGVLEFKVLAILRKRENYLKYKDYIKRELFRSPELQLIYHIINRFHAKYSQPVLSIKNLRMLVERSISTDEFGNYIPLIRRIKKSTIDDDEVIKDCIIKFAQGRVIREIAQTLLHGLEHDPDSIDLQDLRSRLDGAISLETQNRDPEYEYISENHDRLDTNRDPIRIPTGLSKDLDSYIGGGLALGELGVVLAPTGRGKTLALVNLGSTALHNGKRVLHFTLEIRSRVVGRRYDMRTTRSTFQDLKRDPRLLQNKLAELNQKGSRLLVQDYSDRQCGVHQIEAAIERYIKTQPFDLVIVDYADLLEPSFKHKESRFDFTRLYRDLRIIANKYNVALWTASQSNRKSFDKRVVTLIDIDEAIGKAQTADVVLTLSQTPEEREELMMRIFIAKQRSGSQLPTIPVICDFDRMLIKSYKRKEQSQDGDAGSTEENSGDRPKSFSNRSSPYKGKRK